MSVRRATPITITFFLVDPANRPARKSGATFIAGDVKVSQDGASYSNVGTLPTELGVSGRYKLPLTAAEMNGAWIHIYAQNSQIDPIDITLGTDGSPAATIQASGSNTASTFLTDRTEADTDYWKNALVMFTTGANANQVQKVSAYNGSTKFVSVASPFTQTPSAGDRFIFVDM